MNEEGAAQPLIRFLDFPDEVVLEVIKQLEFEDLFFMAIIHRTPLLRRMIKRAHPNNSLWVYLDFDKNNEIHVSVSDFTVFILPMAEGTLDGHEMSFIGDRPEAFKISENGLLIGTYEPIETFRNLMSVFNEMGLNTVVAYLHSKEHRTITATYDIIEQINWKLKQVVIDCKHAPEDVIRRAYQNSLHCCHEVKMLNAGNLLTAPPVLPPAGTESNVQIFVVTSPAKWFTIEHFKTIRNCSIIRIMDAPITYKEFNEVMKQWEAGEVNFGILGMKLISGFPLDMLEGTDAQLHRPNTDEQRLIEVAGMVPYRTDPCRVCYKIYQNASKYGLLTFDLTGWIDFCTVEEDEPDNR